MISRDPRKSLEATGKYCVGFKYDKDKYFHVKLGPKSIICGYENMFDKKAEYYYKTLQRLDAYGLRKASLQPLLDEEPDFKRQIVQYTVEFYHTIIRKPMLIFKRNILSQVTKRQEQDRIMREMDAEIAEKERLYEEERNISFDESDEDATGGLQKTID